MDTLQETIVTTGKVKTKANIDTLKLKTFQLESRYSTAQVVKPASRE